MQGKVSFLLLTLLIWSGLSYGSLRKISQESVSGMRPIESFELPNGLTVVLWPDSILKQVSMRMWYQVGSLHETKGKTGLAHLFEHMLLRPSRYAPGGTLSFERTMGADVGASTRYKTTDYAITVMPEKVDEILRFLADIMKNAPIDEKMLEMEKGAVESEFLNWENNAYMKMMPALVQNVYPGHPAATFVMGKKSDLKNIQVQDARHFYQNYYAPNNAYLVITGGFNAEDILKNIQEYFAPIPSGRTATLPSDLKRLPKQSLTKIPMIIPPDGYPVLFTYSLPFHNLPRPEDSALALAFYAAFEGEASRVGEVVVNQKKMAYYFSHDNKGLGYTFVSGLLRTSRGEDVMKAVDQEVDSLQKMDQATYKKYCVAYTADILRSLQNASQRAFMLGHYLLYRQGVASLNADLSSCHDISLTMFKKTAKKYLKASNRIAVMGVPAKGRK